jgi:hypothetical protein
LGIWKLLHKLNENLIQTLSKLLLRLEALQEFARLLDGLDVVIDQIHFDKRLKIDFLQNKAGEIRICAHNLLQEYHDSQAQLWAVAAIRDDLSNLLIDNWEEFWTEQARTIVVGRNLSVSKQCISHELLLLLLDRGFETLNGGV